jgi:hypothetical protein
LPTASRIAAQGWWPIRVIAGYFVIEAPSGQWDGELIADGIASLERARSGPRGPLLLQAILERTT